MHGTATRDADEQHISGMQRSSRNQHPLRYPPCAPAARCHGLWLLAPLQGLQWPDARRPSSLSGWQACQGTGPHSRNPVAAVMVAMECPQRGENRPIDAATDRRPLKKI